jgi:proteasome-associated ATPase
MTVATETESRDVEKLQEALVKAKEVILEQQDMLNRLTAPPLVYAIVIAVNANPVHVPTPKELSKPGTRVRIRKDSTYYGQDAGVGEVKGPDKDNKGWVIVNFKSGVARSYRVGAPYIATHDGRVIMENGSPKLFTDGLCDLELDKPVVLPSTVTVLSEGKTMEVLIPKDKTLEFGDVVYLSMQTQQIVDIPNAKIQPSGDIGFVRRLVDDMFCEVDHASSVRVVFTNKGKVEKGDRVVLDSSATIVIKNLGKEEDNYKFTAETTVTWDDIGGLKEEKKEMIAAVELPHKHPDIFKYYGKKPVKGVLLWGPPGTGKTMMGKAAAASLAGIYKGENKSTGFIYIKGPEILSKWVGETEGTIRQIFQRARKHKETHGYPAIIFIDEADAVLSKRGSNRSSDVDKTIVPMFLAEMDGMDDSGALVVLATNRSDALDPAVVRDGRIDRKIKIGRPNAEAALEIFSMYLKRVPLKKGHTHEELARLGVEETFRPDRILYKIVRKEANTMDFTLGHIVNGGMISSIVDHATSIALDQDLEKNRKTGLGKDHIVEAVNRVDHQNRDLNHDDDLAEFTLSFKDDVQKISRFTPGVTDKPTECYKTE